MILTNLFIVGFVAIGFIMGYRRGFVVVAAKLIGFILAAVVAALLYRSIIMPVSQLMHLLPSFAGVVSFAILFTIVEVIYFLAIRWILRRLPPQLLHAKLNRWAGCITNGLKSLILVAVLLMLFKGLPLTGAQRDRVVNASFSRGLAHFSRPLQGLVDYLFSGTVTNTVNFFSVKPESHEKIDLDFRTTAVRDDDTKAAQMLDLVNHERTSRGLQALKANPRAAAVARSHARDMFAKGYFAHQDLDGKDPFDRLKAGGVKYIAAGENLALAPTLELAHSGLMNSPPHRANILSIDYSTVGIGVIDGGRYGLMIAQEFTD